MKHPENTPKSYRIYVLRQPVNLCYISDMMIYMIYINILQLGLQPVAVVSKLAPKKGKKDKAKQYTKQYKNTEYTNLKTNIQNKKTNTGCFTTLGHNCRR